MSKKLAIALIIIFTFAGLFLGYLILKGYYDLTPKSTLLIDQEKREDERQTQYRLAYNDIKGDLKQTIALNKGTAIFELRHTGAGKYSFRLLDVNENLLFDIAEGNGDFKDKKYFEVPETNAYLLEVKAEGVWTFKYK